MTDISAMEILKSLKYLIDNSTYEYLEVSLVLSSKESFLAVRLFKATSTRSALENLWSARGVPE